MNLQQSTVNLDETRRRMLNDLLRKRYEYKDVPDYYVEQQIKYYLDQLDKGEPITKLRPQEELTQSEYINDEMKEFEIDIHTIFNQLNHVSHRINQHKKLNESIINDVRVRIHKVDNEIEETSYLLRNNSAHSIFYETFLDYKNRERDMAFYTERTGNEVAPDYQCTIDTQQNSLKLPVLNTENQLINFAGVKMAQVRISKQIGGGFIRSRNPEHSIEKAIDDSMDTYWNESILVDEPLEVNLGLDYYGVDFGAACELEITFDYICKLNEITLTPFTEYPMQVISILVYDNDNDVEPFELVSPTAIRKNIETTEVISYQFQDVVAKKVKVLLNQQHYAKKDILMNVDDKTLIDAWLKNQDHVEIDEDRIFKPIEQNQTEMYPYWQYMKQYMDDRNIVEEIQRYEYMDFSNRIHLSKYEYQYGLYNIAMNYNEYFYEGIYVTNPLLNSNVHSIQLEATEEHPILEELKMPVTNVEYYITDIEEPKKEDWIPLLPMNTSEIISERLFIEFRNNKYQGQTRFLIDRIRAVRRNGDELRAHQDYSIVGQNVFIHNFDPTWIYTIDYKPSISAYSVDFLERYTRRFFDTATSRNVEVVDTKRHVEELTSVSSSNKFELKYFPFIDKNALNLTELDEEEWNPTYLSNTYLPIKVRLILPDGQYIDQRVDKFSEEGVYLTNKTDYYDDNRSLLTPFKGTNYEYRIEKNMIKFNKNLPEGVKVVVDYPYLTGPIRLKIIMRRNLHEVVGLTPFLHDYKLIFQSLS